MKISWIFEVILTAKKTSFLVDLDVLLLLCLLKIFTSDAIEFYYSVVFTSVTVVSTSVCLGELPVCLV